MGERVPRREDHRFITGHGAYLDNLRVPEALHAVLVRCPFAHAQITNVDTEPALSMPGMVAPFSGADLRPDWMASLPMMRAVTDQVRIPDHWPLAVRRGEVRRRRRSGGRRTDHGRCQGCGRSGSG